MEGLDNTSLLPELVPVRPAPQQRPPFKDDARWQALAALAAAEAAANEQLAKLTT